MHLHAGLGSKNGTFVCTIVFIVSFRPSRRFHIIMRDGLLSCHAVTNKAEKRCD